MHKIISRSFRRVCSIISPTFHRRGRSSRENEKADRIAIQPKSLYTIALYSSRANNIHAPRRAGPAAVALKGVAREPNYVAAT